MTTCHIKSEDGDTMPSQTFLNLDANKRNKLIKAVFVIILIPLNNMKCPPLHIIYLLIYVYFAVFIEPPQLSGAFVIFQYRQEFLREEKYYHQVHVCRN